VWQPSNEQLLYDTAMAYYGTRYVWGGNTGVISGDAAQFDCSGFTIELAQRFGLVSDDTDLNAQGQFNRWKNYNMPFREVVQLGDLVFYGSSLTNIGHVMLALNNDYCIGAQGGGSGTNTQEEAVRDDGFVRIMPIDYRGDRVAIVRPPWGF
jgi:cell wall-associated NlpC family hydrolase